MTTNHRPLAAKNSAPGVSQELVQAVRLAVEARDSHREGQEVRFRCPLPDHADAHPSARWNPETATFYCDVCKLGGGVLKLARLLGLEPRTNTAQRGSVVAEYPYRDESGRLLYVVERLEPKRFLQYRPDGAGGRIYHLGDVPRVPYRLPELLSAHPAEPVLIPEGEKDVDTLRSLGFVATCNAGGAGKWRNEYTRWLQGRDIVVLPDADEPGRRHAEQVARSLFGIAASIKVVVL